MPEDKSATILAHCDGGLYAASSRAALERLGFTKALNAGGYGDVKAALAKLGKPVE